jgi:hypothetical protein
MAMTNPQEQTDAPDFDPDFPFVEDDGFVKHMLEIYTMEEFQNLMAQRAQDLRELRARMACRETGSVPAFRPADPLSWPTGHLQRSRRFDSSKNHDPVK